MLARDSFPADDIKVKGEQGHGTHVAGIAVGRLLNDWETTLKGRLQLMILKVIDSEFRVDAGQVCDAITFAQQNGVQIVNLSLSGPQNATLEDKIMSFKSVLFVIAAGNPESGPGANLDTRKNDTTIGYPAKFTRELPNAISVAAYDDENGRLADFSNYGKETIEIAAPGVNILSTGMENENAVKDGTSQATPFVSLTAALLLSQGFEKEPAAIKQRILASVDVLPALQLHEKVWSKGKLNVEKALAFRQDVVEVSDQNGGSRLVKGTIVAPTPTLICSAPR